MASRYWVGGTGNWSDNANHWSASSGGAPNASLPTSADNVFFDANSFSGSGQTVTVDATANCLSMDWTGATNNPTLATTTNAINYYGNVVLIAAMSITGTTGRMNDSAGSGTQTFNTGGVSVGCRLIKSAAGSTATLQFVSNNVTVTNTSDMTILNGHLDTNNLNLTLSGKIVINGTSQTVTLGSSTISCIGWDIGTAVTPTLTPNTATIIITSSAATARTFAGGGLTYDNVTISGAGNYAMTITGSNTFNTLTVDRSQAAKTLVATGTTQAVRKFVSATSGTTVLTMTNGTWVNLPGIDNAQMDYVTVSGSTASPANTWYAGSHGVDGGGNTGWLFTAGTKIKGGVLVALGIVK